MNGSSGPAVRLTTSPSDISTDAYGTNLLYASESSGNWELFLTPLGGGPLRNLTNNPAQDVAGAFSPDGRSIAFISNRDGVWARWVMNVDGGNPRKLKDVPEGFGPDWPTSRISWGP
jgi:TolB protein